MSEHPKSEMGRRERLWLEANLKEFSMTIDADGPAAMTTPPTTQGGVTAEGRPWTPGPWQLVDDFDRIGNLRVPVYIIHATMNCGIRIHGVARMPADKGDKEHAANARLIAAAPAMFEAACPLVNALNQREREVEEAGGDPWHDDDTVCIRAGDLRALRAALSLATAESGREG